MNNYLSPTSTSTTTTTTTTSEASTNNNTILTGSAPNYHLHHYHHQQQQQQHQQPLDGYEAEIVEDIPEQFDLARYKKAAAKSSGGGQQQQQPPPPINQQVFGAYTRQQQHPQQQQQPHMPVPNPHQQQHQAFLYHHQQQFSAGYMHTPGKPLSNLKGIDTTLTPPTALIAPQLPPQFFSPAAYHYQTSQPVVPPQTSPSQPVTTSSIQQQQQVQFLPDYNQKIHQLITYYPKNELDLTPSQQQQQVLNVNAFMASGGGTISQNGTLIKKKSSSVPRYYPEMSPYEQGQDLVDEQSSSSHKPTVLRQVPMPPMSQQPSHQQPQMLGKLAAEAAANGRKKATAATALVVNYDDDDESDSGTGSSNGGATATAYVKKEYYLKNGGVLMSDGVVVESATTAAVGSSNSNTLPKSNLKGAIKKPGVTFDEKLEVYEVKNPHYGLEIKSEKREQKKKKKDKQKEDELTFKTKLDLKAKIQNQNMIHYYFYEKSLIYSCLCFYEENFYKQSIVKLQEKLRPNKGDEKFRDQLIQLIERDNSTTVEIIRHVKKDYLAKLEPYLNQYQTTVDKLHTIPGMYQIMQTAANSVNFAEIVTFWVGVRVGGGGGGAGGIGAAHDNESPSGIRKILGGHQDARLANPVVTVKTPLQRKADLWMPKHVIAAVDLHVREISYHNFKSITDLIYKLNEICENDLHFVRYFSPPVLSV